MSAAVLVNGRPESRVDCADRGFQYGDGVFTTLPVQSGRPVFLALHLARLARDCSRLGIPCPGAALLETEVRQLCRKQREGVLKIQITRGLGERGYRPPAQPESLRVISLSPGIPTRPGRPEQGARILVCRHRLGSNPALAGIKHMNRLEQILARAEWDSEAVHEGLMADAGGALIEGTMSNLFAVIDGRLVTPDLSHCGVAGVMRSVVLAVARADGIPVDVRAVYRDDLEAATEVFLTNSVIRVWPVVALDDRTWPVGPLTRSLTGRIEARIQAEHGGQP